MKRRAFFLAAVGALGGLPAFGQSRPKLVGVVMQGGAYRVGFDGLMEGIQAEAPGDLVRLVLREGGGDLNAIRSAAREFERGGADVLVAFATTVALAAKEATERVPIVFVAGSDPVRYGLVESIAKPGGRLTGSASFRTEITPKRFALLHELLPSARRVVVFYTDDPALPSVRAGVEHTQATAASFGLELVARQVSSSADIRRELDGLRQSDADAFFFSNDAVVMSQARAIIERATELGMPTMAQYLGLLGDGALAAYGLDFRDEGRVAARYVLRILAGTHPRELPVEVNERHVLGINLRTAKALGLTIPPTLLARADEVIE